MKKISFSLLFAITIVKTNYSQTLHHSSHKHLKPKSLCKVEVDTCSGIPGNTVPLPRDNIRKKIEPPLPGILFIHLFGDDMNKWMSTWNKAFKGFSIPY